MVEFGKKLLTSRVEDWKEYYIDYNRLKSLINKAVKDKQRQQHQQNANDAAAADTNRKLIEQLTTKITPSMHGGTQPGSRSNTNLVLNNAMPEGCVTVVWAFRRMVDHEIQKIVLFVLTREGQLAERLYQLSKDGQILKTKVVTLVQDFRRQEFSQQQQQQQQIHNTTIPATTGRDKTDTWNHLKASTNQHREFAEDLLQFVNFIDLNLTGLRKILKKHDKNFPHKQLSGTYLQQQRGSAKGGGGDDRDLDGGNDGGIDDHQMTDSHLEKLYHFGGLSALVLTLRRAFDDLHLFELHLLTLSDAAKSASQHRSHRRSVSTPPLVSSYGSTDVYLADGVDRVGSSITPKLDNRKTSSGLLNSIPLERNTNGDSHDHMVVFSSPSRPHHLLSTTVTRQHEPVLDQINAARNRLRQTTKYAELVAAQALIFVDDKDQDGKIPDEDKTPASEFTAVQKLSSMLNLVSTFLYMANYYIVAPSVGEYALRLGSDVSMAGFIIGMTPNAALISTVLYGFWSNYSYRNALIFASSSSFCGNILYALALKYDSINMVLMGRFLVGFGSARSINRRYIADVFSKADRTAASADFVTYAALGMAAGPASAFAVGHFKFDPSNLLWADVNAPGWIMIVAWGIFLVLLVAFFEEPDRSRMYANSTEDSPLSEKPGSIVTKTNSSGSPKCIDGEENAPLLIQRGDDGNDSIHTAITLKSGNNEPPLWKNVAVMVSLWMYFVLKLVLEMLMSSSGIVTKFYFDWGQKQCGLFMAAVALLMFPVNIVVAKLSQKYEDRELITAALIVMLVSVVGIIDYLPDQYSVYQYIIFGVGVFVSTNSLEGVNMSLLSKTIPTSWAKGTFNSGFLATEAGTLARSVGDFLISTVMGLFGLENLLDGLFMPMALLCAISLVMVYFSYSQLTDVDEVDDDDDDSDSNTLNDTDREISK